MNPSQRFLYTTEDTRHTRSKYLLGKIFKILSKVDYARGQLVLDRQAASGHLLYTHSACSRTRASGNLHQRGAVAIQLRRHIHGTNSVVRPACKKAVKDALFGLVQFIGFKPRLHPVFDNRSLHCDDDAF